MPTSIRAQALWEPSPERQQQAALTQYVRWLGERRGLRFADYHELWRWSVSDLEGFWSSIWEFFDVQSPRAVRACARRSLDAGRAIGSPAPSSTTPSTCSAGSPTTGSRSSTPPSCGARRADLGRAASPDRAHRGRPARARGRPGRPRGRLHARTSPRRSPRSWPPRASARSGRAARPTSARAAWSTASRRSSRRCCSPSTATATAAASSTASTWSPRCRGRSRASSARSCCRYLGTTPELAGCERDRLGRAPRRRGRRADVRAGPVRPPAVGALLLGHDGAPEGDRARPRRNSARAPQDAPPALRRARRATGCSGSRRRVG